MGPRAETKKTATPRESEGAQRRLFLLLRAHISRLQTLEPRPQPTRGEGQAQDETLELPPLPSRCSLGVGDPSTREGNASRIPGVGGEVEQLPKAPAVGTRAATGTAADGEPQPSQAPALRSPRLRGPVAARPAGRPGPGCRVRPRRPRTRAAKALGLVAARVPRPAGPPTRPNRPGSPASRLNLAGRTERYVVG